MSSWAVIWRRLHPKYIHTSHSWDKEEEIGQDTVWQVATGNPNKVKLRSRVARMCLGRKCIWAKGSKKVNVDGTGGSEWPMLVPQPRHKWRSCLRGLKTKGRCKLDWPQKHRNWPKQGSGETKQEEGSSAANSGKTKESNGSQRWRYFFLSTIEFTF